jgi:hypothetical protein
MSAPTTTTFTRTEAKASDAKLVELMNARSAARARRDSVLDSVHRAANDSYNRQYAPQSGWRMTRDEAIAAAQARIDATAPCGEVEGVAVYPYYIDQAKKALVALVAADEAVEAASTAVAVQDAEWADHGQWNRYGVVPGGHIHREYGCFTIRPTTSFAWAYQVSGDSVADAIEVYGPALCSHCFKDAPTSYVQQAKVAKDADGNPLTVAQAQAAADAKAAAKAEREAKKAAKAARAAARASA